VGWRAASPPSHPAAQALLGGLLQGIGERENDEAMADAGRRLGEAAEKGPPAAPGWRWRASRLWTSLGPQGLAAVLALSKHASKDRYSPKPDGRRPEEVCQIRT
jgi:hypothetical protein